MLVRADCTVYIGRNMHAEGLIKIKDIIVWDNRNEKCLVGIWSGIMVVQSKEKKACRGIRVANIYIYTEKEKMSLS